MRSGWPFGAVLAVALGACACGAGPTTEGQNTHLQGQSGTGISIVHLPDTHHTECAVLDGVHGIAISCDWSK